MVTNAGVCHVTVSHMCHVSLVSDYTPGADSSILLTESPIAPSCLAERAPTP